MNSVGQRGRVVAQAAGSVLFFAFLRALWFSPLLEIARGVWMPHLQAPVFGFLVVLTLPMFSQLVTRFLVAAGDRPTKELPVINNIKLVVFGQCAVLFVLWHRFYRDDHVFVDPAWLQVLALRLVEGGEAALVAWFAAGVATFLWVVGMSDAFHGFSHHRVASTMRLGLVSFAFQALTLRLEGVEHAPSLTISIVAFFGLCALGLALASTQVAGGLSVPLGARSPRTVLRMRLGWPWLYTTGGSVACVLVLGLLGATLASSRAISMVVNGWHLVVRATLHGALALATFVDTVLLPWLQPRRTDTPGSEPLQGQPGPAPFEGGRPSFNELPQPNEGFTIGLVVVVVALALVAVGLILVFFQLVRRRATDEDGVESAISTEIDWSGFRDLFRRTRERRFGARRGHPFLSLAGENAGRRRVREAYQEFLRSMASLGLRRNRSMPPVSFEARVRRYLVEGREVDDVSIDLQTLSRAYSRVRYGDASPSAEDAGRVVEAWRRLRSRADCDGR